MEFKVQTFISIKVTKAPPIQEYVAIIVDGAKNNKLPDDYISNIMDYIHYHMIEQKYNTPKFITTLN